MCVGISRGSSFFLVLIAISITRSTVTAFMTSSKPWRVSIGSIGIHYHQRLTMKSIQTWTCHSAIVSTTSDGVYIVNAMPEPLPDPLQHRYFLLRHGQSTGNVEGVISSARSLARSSQHGLTQLGIQQGKESASNFLSLLKEQKLSSGECLLKDTHPTRVFFYSSPFARARQTAEACQSELLTREDHISTLNELYLQVQKDIQIEDGLMERFFGDLDGTPLPTYAYVWPEDQRNVTQTGTYHVESVAAVATRLREVIQKIEDSSLHRDHSDIIILTSHADVCQILQLYASGIDNVGDFSSYRFANGEIRFMGRTVDTLPPRQPLEMPNPLPEVKVLK